MDYRKLLGILFIILGFIFTFYPVYSAEAVSWIAHSDLLLLLTDFLYGA